MSVPALPGAARMPLTVLYWDIAGSCALLRELTLETYCRVVRACQEQAAEAVEAHGGYVARFMGDGLLAYFGFPHAAGDDPARAVRAALSVPLDWSHAGIAVCCRAAVASGPVIIGPPIGRDAAREFPAFGQAPSLAARLLAVAGPGSVVVDADTGAALGGAFPLQPITGLSLRGFPHIGHAWRVLPPADLLCRAA
jgi:class 3 adenylate cyclase